MKELVMRLYKEKEELFKFLCWVNTHDRNLLVKTWVLEENEPEGETVHADVACKHLKTENVLCTMTAPNEHLSLGRASSLACNCVETHGFESLEIYEQAYEVYELSCILQTMCEPSENTCLLEESLFVPLRAVGAVKATEKRWQRVSTGLVEKLAQKVADQRKHIMAEYDTTMIREKGHAWARKLALANKVAWTQENYPVSLEFEDYFEHSWAWSIASGESFETALKHFEAIPGLEKQNKLRRKTKTWYRSYTEDLAKQEAKIHIVSALLGPMYTLALPHKNRMLYHYLCANIVTVNKANSNIMLYRIDSEMAEWMKHAAQEAGGNKNRSHMHVETVSRHDIQDPVLEVASSLWKPESRGVYANLEDIIPVAETLIR